RHTSAWVARTKAATATGSPVRAASASRVVSDGGGGFTNPHSNRELFGALERLPGMDCENARTALSAQLDGESVPEAEGLRLHLGDCADCRAWRQRAQSLSHNAGAAFAAVPDLTVPVLEAVSAAETAAAARRRARARV